MERIRFRDDVTQKDIIAFLVLVVGLILWAWFTFEVILK